MSDRFVSRGFFGKRRQPDAAGRIPPGQHLVGDFPVLSAGPTPQIRLDDWQLTIYGLVREPVAWNWAQFNQLPTQSFTVDIHCVTKWSKLDTHWQGVSVDTLLEHVELDPTARFVTAHSYGGYTTNMPLTDLLNGRAFIGFQYDGKPLSPEHGGPARLVVPDLYLWKSAKWVRGLELMAEDRRGFWESLGYSNKADPWKEQRYSGDD
jgi:DMSO/TMAO reductase YedYZ molybdopterin-dependent catalytic subunit